MQTISINSFPEKEEELLGQSAIKTINQMKRANEYRVSSYDPMCEDHAQIERIIPVTFSCFKIFIFVIVCILTGSLALFFVIWFPKLKFIFIYSVVPIEQAKMVALWGTDGELYFVPLKKPSLPDLEAKNSFIYSQFNRKFIKIVLIKLFILLIFFRSICLSDTNSTFFITIIFNIFFIIIIFIFNINDSTRIKR